MANPIPDYEALIDAVVASPSRTTAQAAKDGFDPFVAALLDHFTAHFVKHLDAAETTEALKPVAERNQPAIDWSIQVRAALIAAESDSDGGRPIPTLAETVSPSLVTEEG